jgi:hypothetical protein
MHFQMRFFIKHFWIVGNFRMILGGVHSANSHVPYSRSCFIFQSVRRGVHACYLFQTRFYPPRSTPSDELRHSITEPPGYFVKNNLERGKTWWRHRLALASLEPRRALMKSDTLYCTKNTHLTIICLFPEVLCTSWIHELQETHYIQYLFSRI